MKTVVVHPERCIGCRQCEVACAVEHSESKDLARAVVERPLPKPRIHVESAGYFNASYPVRCRHCDPAPCIDVCPTGSLLRDGELDLVLTDQTKCIGCAMCAMVCPFDAVTFHPLATKCDGCADRVRAGREPACVEVCKVDALVFDELDAVIRAGRARLAEAALAAAKGATTLEGSGDAGRTGTERTEPLTAWRSWGERASELARR